MEQLDLGVLYFLNQTVANDTLDAIVKYLTNVRHWIPVYILASTFLVWKYKWYGVRMVIAVAVVAGFTDFITNQFIKGWIARPRPSPTLIEWLRLPDGGRAGFGMPSSHAVNNFAAATFFVILFPSRKIALSLFFIALLIALTRPYLGLHYPTDIIAGAAFGTVVGYLFAKAFLWVEERFFKPKSGGEVFSVR